MLLRSELRADTVAGQQGGAVAAAVGYAQSDARAGFIHKGCDPRKPRMMDGADIDDCDLIWDLAPPLHLAVRDGCQESVNALLGAASASDVKEMLCAQHDCAEWWGSQRLTPLHVCAQQGNATLLPILVEGFPAAIDARQGNGRTPLLVAAREGKAEANDKVTAAYLAAMQGHTDVLRCLAEDKRTDLHKEGPHRATPLMIAARRGNLDAAGSLAT
eukprot:gene57161-biopygen80704